MTQLSEIIWYLVSRFQIEFFYITSILYWTFFNFYTHIHFTNVRYFNLEIFQEYTYSDLKHSALNSIISKSFNPPVDSNSVFPLCFFDVPRVQVQNCNNSLCVFITVSQCVQLQTVRSHLYRCLYHRISISPRVSFFFFIGSLQYCSLSGDTCQNVWSRILL